MRSLLAGLLVILCVFRTVTACDECVASAERIANAENVVSAEDHESFESLAGAEGAKVVEGIESVDGVEIVESVAGADTVEYAESVGSVEGVSAVDKSEYVERVKSVACVARAGDNCGNTIVGIAVGAGEESSMSIDLFLKRSFACFASGEAWSVKPLIGALAFGWFRDHDTVGGGALVGGLNLDFAGGERWRPYTEATFGGAFLSKTSFGDKRFGTAFQFRSNLGLGVKFGQEMRNNIQAEVTHYSNAGIKKPNGGYTALSLSYGFSF